MVDEFDRSGATPVARARMSAPGAARMYPRIFEETFGRRT